MGVLETLRQNPDYAHLPDAGAALAEAIKTGVSRYPTSTGRGQGFVQLCRSMVTDRAELRFRSGDHALLLCPTTEIGIASCRATVSQYVSISVGGGAFKK